MLVGVLGAFAFVLGAAGAAGSAGAFLSAVALALLGGIAAVRRPGSGRPATRRAGSG